MRLDLLSFGALELARVVATLPRAELARRRLGPRDAAAKMRRLGERRAARDEAARARLRRAIGLVDRLCFGAGSSCYRRVLAEIALDAGAAREPLMLGFRVPGGPRSGHAWLGGARDGEPGARYDAIVSV